MKNLNIKPVNHGKTRADKNRYCGPSVISAITGMTTGEAARLLRHITGRPSIRGSSYWAVTRALEMCGIRAIDDTSNIPAPLNRRTGPTLAAWLKANTKNRTPDRVFLIVAGWHWQLVQGRRIVCGILGEPTSIRDKRVKRRARVAYAAELHSMGAITTPSEAKKPKSVDRQRSNRSKAQSLAKKLGITIDSERLHQGCTHYWITYEGEFDYVDNGIIEGHYCADWQEVLWKLEDIEAYEAEKRAA